MPVDLANILCTQCGLCCDGSLFADVELTGVAEGAGLEVMGLDIEEGDADDSFLLQPCRALRGQRCGLYAYRPECCRTFECHLLHEVRCGALGVEQAAEQIEEVRQRVRCLSEMLTDLGLRDDRLPLKERCLEALTLVDETDIDPLTSRMRDRLEAGMFGLEALIQERFLVS